MLLQRANSTPTLLPTTTPIRRTSTISQTPPQTSSSSLFNNVEYKSKPRSLSITPLRAEFEKSKLQALSNSRPQTPTSPSSPLSPSKATLISPKGNSSLSGTKPNVVSEKKGSLHLDLDKLDEWLQPEETLRPTLTILSPKQKQISPTVTPRERSNSIGRFDSLKLDRMCTSPTFTSPAFSSPKNSSPLNRVLQQEGNVTPKLGRNRSMSNISSNSAFSDLSYRSSLSSLSIQYLEPEDDDYQVNDESSEDLESENMSVRSGSNPEEQKFSSSESSESDNEDEVIQSATSFDQLFHKKFSKLPSHTKSSPLDSLLKTTMDEDTSTNFVTFRELLKNTLQEGKKLGSKKSEQESLKKKGVKSLSWLKTLIDKLYTYSHDLFTSKGSNIQQQLYTTPMIIFSIMKTKFVYSTVTNINWHDMLKSAKAYRKHDFEVETFYKFMSGEYTLETFIWFVCSRYVANKAVEELDKKLDDVSTSETETVISEPTTSTSPKSVLSDILERKKRKILALERKEENRHNPEKSKSFITMQNAIHAVCELANKKLIQTVTFLGATSVNDKVIDPYTLKHNVENVLIRKFGLIRSKELKNEEAISLPQFLGFIVSIKATKLEHVFNEVKKFMVKEDHGMLERFCEASPQQPLRNRTYSAINISTVLEKLTDIAHQVEDAVFLESPRETRDQPNENSENVSSQEKTPVTEISPSKTPPSLEKSLSNLNLSIGSVNIIGNRNAKNAPEEEQILETEPNLSMTEEISIQIPKDEEDIEASLSNEVVKMINTLCQLMDDMPRTPEGIEMIYEVFIQHVEHILDCLPTLGKVQEQYATVLLEDLLFNTREMLNRLPFFSNFAAELGVKINQWLVSEVQLVESPVQSPVKKIEEPSKDPIRSDYGEQLTMNKLKDVLQDDMVASELMDLLAQVKNL